MSLLKSLVNPFSKLNKQVDIYAARGVGAYYTGGASESFIAQQEAAKRAKKQAELAAQSNKMALAIAKRGQPVIFAKPVTHYRVSK